MAYCLRVCPPDYTIPSGVSAFIQASPVSMVCGLSVVTESNVAGMETRGGIAREFMPQLGQLDSDLISQAAKWAGRQREPQPGAWAISSFGHRNSFHFTFLLRLSWKQVSQRSVGSVPLPCDSCLSCDSCHLPSELVYIDSPSSLQSLCVDFLRWVLSLSSL